MDDGPFLTNVPARLDRLRWSSFHASLIAALGTSLDHRWAGGHARRRTGRCADLAHRAWASPSEVGEAAGAYVAGAVIGAILFGGLADRYGRRRLFFITLGVYAAATIASGLATNYLFSWSRGFSPARALEGIRGNQFGDPGIHACALAWARRSCDQWELLDRRRWWSDGRGTVPRYGVVRAGVGLADCVHRRRFTRIGDSSASTFCTREPALAPAAAST